MNISSVSTCSGCMACIDKCPHSCITIVTDKLGHLLPSIIESKCSDCGVCLKVCPSENKTQAHFPMSAWAAWRKEDNLRLASSSGGAASVISEFFIKEKGIVYGCAFVSPFSFKHIRCESIEELQLLKGSKYVQSDTNGVYRSIAKDLAAKKKVLFTGTPCQIAGVKHFFKNNESAIYTIDLICHGVPSVDMLKVSLPEEVLKHHFCNVSFRCSTFFHFSIKNATSVVYERALHKDLFLKGFFTALFYRDACYSCLYAKPKRIGDITLGDFWGIDTTQIKTDPQKGISLCMLNTSKGEELFRAASSQLETLERPVEEAISGNAQLKKPMHKSIRAKIFRKLYPIVGFKWSVYSSIPEIVIKNKLKKR